MQLAPLLLIVAASWLTPGNAAAAAEATGIQREIILGSELMTSQEREQYRQRMRGARSTEERDKAREEHVKQMRERARLRGLRLVEPATKGAP